MSETRSCSADSASTRLAVIGDLHDSWSDFDVAFLNDSDYDGVIFVGDLGRGEETSRRISRSIGRLELPTLILPGNADAPHAPRIRAEFALQRGLDRLLGEAAPASHAPAFSGVRLCGYSLHRIALGLGGGGPDFTILAGRPYSMGGPELAFERELDDGFGIKSLEDSTSRLRSLVDAVETEDLIFVSHNGPFGLGDRPTDLWGCDFLPDRTDWGEPDLALAIEYARTSGRRVLAVVAGHMHHGTKENQGLREWTRREQDVLFVNPARVPRIETRPDGEHHHHVALTITREGVEAEERFVQS